MRNKSFVRSSKRHFSTTVIHLAVGIEIASHLIRQATSHFMKYHVRGSGAPCAEHVWDEGRLKKVFGSGYNVLPIGNSPVDQDGGGRR